MLNALLDCLCIPVCVYVSVCVCPQTAVIKCSSLCSYRKSYQSISGPQLRWYPHLVAYLAHTYLLQRGDTNHTDLRHRHTLEHDHTKQH